MSQYSIKRKKKSKIFDLAFLYVSMIKNNENQNLTSILNENWMDEWHADQKYGYVQNFHIS